jgi:uncharacterized protein YkwD
MKIKFFLFIIIIFLQIQINAQDSLKYTGSNLSAADAKIILNHHNMVRATKGAPPLEWDTAIARYAQEWANYLVNKNHNNIDHRFTLGENIKPFGENLFWGSDFNYYTVLDASKAWYDEKEIYVYEPISTTNFHESGHYSQMMWNTTKQIGVGIAKGTDGSIIVVANYFPAGNILGKLPY